MAGLQYKDHQMDNFTREYIDPISDSEREIYDIVNYVFITSAICLFGVTTNIINIIVFYKQGFNNTVTISFFGLAISDLCSLITMLWFGICANPLFINSEIRFFPEEIQYLSAGIPHICFARITCWITVFITAERCLCIAMPLKIKRIVTPKRTTYIIVSIYLSIMTSFFPEYATTYYDWKFFSSRNRTLLGVVFTANRHQFEGLVYFTYSALGLISFVSVVAFTVIIVVQLNRKSRWRMKATTGRNQSESISNKETKTMIMVVMIATVLIICFIPGVTVSIVTFFEAEFSIVGKYVNAFFVMWSFVFIFETFNSSINILFYYNMSTKYRHTFQQVFGSINYNGLGKPRSHTG